MERANFASHRPVIFSFLCLSVQLQLLCGLLRPERERMDLREEERKAGRREEGKGKAGGEGLIKEFEKGGGREARFGVWAKEEV